MGGGGREREGGCRGGGGKGVEEGGTGVGVGERKHQALSLLALGSEKV